MASSGSIDLKINATESSTNDFGNPTWAGALSHAFSLADGTAANQFDLVFADERTIASASNDDLDLSGVLTTPMGTTITAAEAVMIVIANKQKDGTANTTDLTIGGGSNPFTGFLGGTTPTVGPIKPGGFFAIGSPDAAGIGTITAATADILRISNSSGATNTYQIFIFARTA